MRFYPAALLLILLTQAFTSKSSAFVSKRATEAILRFTFEVHIEQSSPPNLEQAKAHVESQVLHMFGPMERAVSMAAPKEDHEIFINPERIENIPGTSIWRIPYHYEGMIVLETGPRIRYSFPLPIDPTKIYQSSLIRGENLCSDEHYPLEEDFWYFWSPANWGLNPYPDCRLRSNENQKIEEDEDYEIVEAEVERLPNERTVYPEYDRLSEDGVIDIHLYYGKDEAGGSLDPKRSKDLNAKIYRRTFEDLSALGFTFRRWSEDEISEIAPNPSSVFIEEAEKVYSDGSTVRVRLFFGETGIDQASTAFHYLFRDSLKNASVMIYNGHSGLGGHLDLKAISSLHGFRLSPNKDLYQIYFFNSCTSYTYYNSMYFNRKRKNDETFADSKGIKNLDIMANGTSTAFEVEYNSDMVLIEAIDHYATRKTWTSYQHMAQKIDSDNLFTVNGDEDNPTERR